VRDGLPITNVSLHKYATFRMRSRTSQSKSWDIKIIQEAVGAVDAGKFTPSTAHFGVRRTTLRRQLRYDAVPRGTGRKHDIPPETEQELVGHIS
jgi:hypothetical protein